MINQWQTTIPAPRLRPSILWLLVAGGALALIQAIVTGGRAASIFGNANLLAPVMVGGIVLSRREGRAIPAGICIAALIVSGSRGAALALALVAVGAYLAGLIGVNEMLAGIVLAGVMLVYRDLTAGRALAGVLAQGPPGMTRADLWRIAVKLWIGHPLTGIGPRGFATVIGIPQSHAHSLYLQVLAEFGLYGAGLLAALVVALKRRATQDQAIWLAYLLLDGLTEVIYWALPVLLVVALIWLALGTPGETRAQLQAAGNQRAARGA